MNQQLADIAARVFWENVRKSSYETISIFVTSKMFSNLWKKEDVPAYLKKLNMQTDPSAAGDQNAWIYNKVNELMYIETQEERNIVGTLYVDDFEQCKTPDFNDEQQILELKEIYKEKEHKEIPNLEKIGTLILRSPLPAVVYTNSNHIPRTFLVNDTSKALGFQTNLIFNVQDNIPFPNNPYGVTNALIGIFQIQNYKNTDTKWYKLIPNSSTYENMIFKL